MFLIEKGDILSYYNIKGGTGLKNIELLFSQNGTINKKKVGLDKNILNIRCEGDTNIFSGIQIDNIIKTINAVHAKYGNMKFNINIYIGEVIFIDKLTYVLFECICYFLVKKYGNPVQIFMKVESDIYTEGINSSPLIFLNDTTHKTIAKFPSHFEFDLYGSHFRKMIRCPDDEKTNYLGELDEQIDRFLKPFGIEQECRDQISLVIIELVGNACEHAKSDCLLDIDVAPNYKKMKNETLLDDDDYYGINIAIVDFAEKLLGSDIHNNVLSEQREMLPDRYKKVIDGYNNHLQYFDADYTMEDFCNIAAFQKKISGRKEKFQTGGVGLPELIKSLEDRSDTYRCYMISGRRCINFYNDLLEYDKDGFIGFNETNDFLTSRPKQDVVTECLINMPGTAYNLNFVMKGKKWKIE